MWSVRDEIRELGKLNVRDGIPISGRIDAIVGALADRDCRGEPSRSLGRIALEELGLPEHKLTSNAAFAKYAAAHDDIEAALDRAPRRRRCLKP
jgi:hypothetical protein